jgi:hypothetical protein
MSPTAAGTPPTDQPTAEPVAWNDVAETDWFDSAKSVLALVGLAAVALQLMRLVK